MLILAGKKLKDLSEYTSAEDTGVKHLDVSVQFSIFKLEQPTQIRQRIQFILQLRNSYY